MVRTLVDQVHASLRDGILAGRWHLGERLYEETIAAGLEVSRASLREAIRLLEQEGLVVRRAHRGLFVASPNPREIVETASYRALLEVASVHWGHPHADEDVADLFTIANHMDDAAARNDVLNLVKLDLGFHSIVTQVSTNSILLKHFHELDGHMALFLHAIVTKDREPLADMGARHREIARSIREKSAVDKTIFDHYRSASDVLIERSGVKETKFLIPTWRIP